MEAGKFTSLVTIFTNFNVLFFTSFRIAFQYSFVGPLSMSKGCDQAHAVDPFELPKKGFPPPSLPDYMYRGDNPAVITDASCYMDWIAEQYDLTLPSHISYKYKRSCHQSTGDINDVNEKVCK